MRGKKRSAAGGHARSATGLREEEGEIKAMLVGKRIGVWPYDVGSSKEISPSQSRKHRQLYVPVIAYAACVYLSPVKPWISLTCIAKAPFIQIIPSSITSNHVKSPSASNIRFI